MSLLEGKGWIAQEFFNEYLDLKTEISQLVLNLEYMERRGFEEHSQEKKEEIKIKVERLKFVLQELKRNGVKSEDLILLAIGVDEDKLNK